MDDSKRFHTPLRYPGGKGKFASFVKKLMELNNIKGAHYLEPYAGGAGVALDLLYSNYCTDIHINDYDQAIFHFWQAVTQNTEDFLKLLVDTPITISEWEKQKLVLSKPEEFGDLKHGFAAFFLNRTNRSGILKGGVVGGKNQNGRYKLDARFQKPNLIKRIEKIGQHASRIHVTNKDALELIKQVDKILPNNSLIYLDPPYYLKGQGLYRNFYEHEDHELIREALNHVRTRWIVSYDNCEPIKKIYHGYRQDEYSLNYSAYVKTKGSEVMIYCDELKVLSTDSPLNQLQLAV